MLREQFEDVKKNIEKDFTDIIYDLLKRASMAGMLPNQFWEHEPVDIVDYIEAREENQGREMYYSSVLVSRFIAISIGNMFSKSKHDLPQYEELFAPAERSLDRRIDEIRNKFGGYVRGR